MTLLLPPLILLKIRTLNRAYVVNDKNDINPYDEVALRKSAYEELQISLR